MAYRCIKCTDNHEPGQYSHDINPFPDEGPIPTATCVNCGKTGHPANYKNCPKYIEIKDRFKNKRDDLAKTNQFKNFSINNLRKPNISFANSITTTSPLNQTTTSSPELQKRQSTHNTTKNLQGFDFLNQEAQTLFGNNILTLLTKINEFIPQYRNITNTTEKKILNLCLS